MTDLDHSTRYDLMASVQATPSEMAEWLKEPGFAAYVAERQGGKKLYPVEDMRALIEAIIRGPEVRADTLTTEDIPGLIETFAIGLFANSVIPGNDPRVLWEEDATDKCREVFREEARKVFDLIRSLASTIPAAEPVVKPLEWRDGVAGSYTVIADTVLGQYSAWHIKTNGFWRTPGGRFGKLCGSILETAKAAAQADYEQRIRSALVAAPQPARETDDAPGLETAAKWHDGEADKALDRLQTAVDRKKRLWLADANRMHRKSAAALRARCQP